MNICVAYAGVIPGGLSTVLFKTLKDASGSVGIFAVYQLLPAFILSSVVIVAVSLATKAPDQSILDEFDLAKKKQEE